MGLVHSPSAHTHRDADKPVLVWAVTGFVGEYSDRSEWVAKVFADEADAKAYVEHLDALGRDWWDRWSACRYDDDDRMLADEAVIRAHEPRWCHDYTGPAAYTAEAVEFIAKATTAASESAVGTKPEGRSEPQ